MNTAWNYATIAFQPYPDVGEFVNVGILALAMPARVLACRLLPAQATTRIHGFFPELDLNIYKEGRKRLKLELDRLEQSVNQVKGGAGGQHSFDPSQPLLPGAGVQGDPLFKMLTAPRDGLFRFHAKGTRLAIDAASLLDDLFARYITRNTAETSDPEEMRLVREVGTLLEQWKLRQFYRKDVLVGPNEFPIRFPFGYQPDPEAAPQRVIKPLNLAQANPLQVFHHGDVWVANVNRLHRMEALPPHVLLSVKMPLATRGAASAVIRAAEEIRSNLANIPIQVVEANDTQALREFAEIPQSTTLSLTA